MSHFELFLLLFVNFCFVLHYSCFCNLPKLSRQINELKFSLTICLIQIQLKFNISETCSVSISSVDMATWILKMVIEKVTETLKFKRNFE